MLPGFLQLVALYASNGHDSRSEYNWQKSKGREHQQSWERWGCYGTLVGGFRGQTTLRKSLGHKEHLDWLKIDFNVAKNITAQGYNKKKIVKVNGTTHIQCSS